MVSKVIKFGVRFAGDNDFITVCRTFVEVICQRGPESYNLTKETLCELFNRSATGLYWLAQNQLRYETSADQKIHEYLKIEPKDIYLNEEIDAFLASGQQNGDMTVADFSNPSLPPHIYTA